MTTVLRAARDQVLAFRLDGHHLSRRRPPDALLEVAAACGIRNTPPGSAALAMHARVRGQAGMSATEALQQAADVAWAELDGRMLARGELSGAMTRRLPDVLGPWCAACKAWHVHEMLFRLVGVRGVFVVARPAGKNSLYVRADQWLGARPDGDHLSTRAELLRRYLRCYGPSTAGHFAAWAGIAPADGQRSWDQVADQLVAVDLEGRRAWLHAADVARLETPATPAGLRLLPPYDSYLDQRDRATLLPDEALHRRVWRPIGNPGVVIADGQVVGLWRPRKTGKRLVVAVETVAPVSRSARAEIEAEAALLAPYRGCTSAEVAFTR